MHDDGSFFHGAFTALLIEGCVVAVIFAIAIMLIRLTHTNAETY